MLSIALDWDGTFTEDPDLWRLFVSTAKQRGHAVYFVTARHPSGEVEDEARRLGIEAVFTGGRPKIASADAQGLLINVWIDDLPGLLFKDVTY